MSKPQFLFFLLLIALLGLWLRLFNYDRIPPFGETKDEFVYPWIGMSLIQTGVPTGWSLLPTYTNVQQVNYWGEQFRLVSPWLERSSLYSLLVGSATLLAHQNEFAAVRLATVRLVPISLSLISLLLLGLIAHKAYNTVIALVAALIYATSPIMVMAHRLSVTENLLTPLFLAGIWLFYEKTNKIMVQLQPYILGAISLAALLTKPTGIALPATLMLLSLKKRAWPTTMIVGIASVIGLAVGPLMGFTYDWQFYQNLQRDLLFSVNYGLPETFSNFFRFIGIGHKESLFLDGTLIVGLILLFAAPFLKHDADRFSSIFVLPYLYVVVLILILSGATWYGWYVFPLHAFVALIVAVSMYEIWAQSDYFKLMFFFIFLGSSSLRFFLLTTASRSWQTIFVGLFVVLTTLWWLHDKRLNRTLLVGLFTLYIGVNCYTIINLHKVYPSRTQPANHAITTP